MSSGRSSTRVEGPLPRRQKAGSTALAALLAASPHVRFAPAKELHYLDASFCRGTGAYLARMKPLDALPAPWPREAPAAGEFVTAEATPFYVACGAASSARVAGIRRSFLDTASSDGLLS